MRISGGDARGIRLKVPKGARPVTERVRQAIFSSLAAELPDARVLDLYAGSGAYGLEAVSRGAASAVLVDSDPSAVAVCRANARAAGLDERVVVRRADTGAYLTRRARSDGPFDLVFADPPYGRLDTGVLEVLTSNIAPGGRFVLEARYRSGDAPPPMHGMVVQADRRYGDTRVLIMKTRGDVG